VSIEIANESGLPVDEAALASLARHVLDEMHVHPLAELSLLLVDEPAMTELHVRWMGEEGPTDVLAFPMDELRPPQPGGAHVEQDDPDAPGIPGLLGDVVICPQVAAVQARRARHVVADEINLLATHGILHLLGYDHADAREHAAMFGLQDRLLASWQAERGGDGSGAPGIAGDTPPGHQSPSEAPAAPGEPGVPTPPGAARAPGLPGPVRRPGPPRRPG
jgi:probable rRNA maturation factor